MTDETQPVSPAPNADPTPGNPAPNLVDTGAATTPPAADAGAETPATNEGEGDQPKPRKRGGGFQDRIKELTGKIRERDQIIAELSTPKAGSDANDGAAPKRENYASYEAYIEALAEHRATQTFERKERESAAKASADARDDRMSTLKAEMAADAAEDANFAKAWATVSGNGFPVSDPMGEFIAESDAPHALIEWLANNRAEAAKLYNASPGEVSRALARVEAGIAKTATARTPQAPPPPPTVGGRSTPRVDLAKLAQNPNPAEYIAKRREQMEKAR